MCDFTGRNKIEKNANQMAAAEGKFTNQSVIEELEPLLKEYFIGKFELSDEKIILEFKNGQKFCLTVSEAE
ncbi:MAG TPA: hypothetical protein DD415_01950 [Clostridiales bacterium]|nr:hypothetical protein [Clostridiales bacterium]